MHRHEGKHLQLLIEFPSHLQVVEVRSVKVEFLCQISRKVTNKLLQRQKCIMKEKLLSQYICRSSEVMIRNC